MTMFQFKCKFRRLRRYLLAPGFFAVVAIIAVLAAAASADTIANPKENPYKPDFAPKVYQAMVGWSCGGVKMGIQTADAENLMLTSLFLAGRIAPIDWANYMVQADPKRARQYIRMAELCQGGPRT